MSADRLFALAAPVGALACAVALTAAAGALPACTTSTTATTYTPYTGIDVPTASVTAGVGCSGADSGGGIDHYVAFLASASEAGAPAAVAPASIMAAGSFACFTPDGVFENIDASATYDVWIFGFPAGLPSGAAVACDLGTCALTPGAAWATLLDDMTDAGEVPTVALRCTAVGELGSHPSAYGCQPVAAVAAAAPADGGAADAGLGDGAAADGALADGGLVDGASLADGSADASGD